MLARGNRPLAIVARNRVCHRIHASVLRETNTQGKAARFKKVARGQFALASRR
jgi:hypothetical protein